MTCAARLVGHHKPSARVRRTLLRQAVHRDGDIMAELRMPVVSDVSDNAASAQVTLMDWGNCVVERIERTDAASAVTAVEARLHLEGDFKRTRLKLTWLADVPELVPLRLVELGDLITKAKMRRALWLLRRAVANRGRGAGRGGGGPRGC
jgi:small-conductance mechanosensitive channel